MLADGLVDVVVSAGYVGVYWHRFDGTGYEPRRLIDENLPGPSEFFSIASADLSNDSRPDIALAGGNSVAWHANNGTGTSPAGRITLSSFVPGAQAVNAVDIDQDGSVDVAALSSKNGTIVLFFNTGAGLFPTSVVINGTSGIGSEAGLELMASGEFVTGRIDLVTVASKELKVAVLIGGLERRVIDTSAPAASDLAIASIDADLTPEIVVAEFSPGRVYVYSFDGDARPWSRRVALTSSAVTALGLLDVTGDGVLDIFISTIAVGVQQMPVFVNDGLGGFHAAGVNLNVGAASFANFLRIPRANSFEIVLAGGLALFSIPITPSAMANVTFSTAFSVLNSRNLGSLVAADFSLDGIVDFLFADEIASSVSILYGTPSGISTVTSTVGMQVATKAAIAGDMDDSGTLDACVASRNGPLGLVCYLNDVKNGLWSAHVVTSSILFLRCLAVGDIDGDSTLDLCAGTGLNQLACWRNTGKGKSFTLAMLMNVSTLPGQPMVTAIALEDADGDAQLDVFVGSDDRTLHWRPATSLGFTQPAMLIATAFNSFSTIIAFDMAADGGSPDVLVGVRLASLVLVALNNGTGGFRLLSFAMPGSYMGLALGDMTGDGVLDLIVTDSLANAVVLLLNNKTALHTPTVLASFASPLLFVNGVLVTDATSDGIPDVCFSGAGLTCLKQIPALPAIRPFAALPVARACVQASRMNSTECLLATLGMAVSSCLATRAVLRSPTVGCLDTPYAPLGMAPLRVEGNGHTIYCTSRDRQVLFSLGPGSTLALHNMTLDLSGAGPALAGPSVLSVCNSDCEPDDTASLSLVNVTLRGFANGGVHSLFTPDLSLGAVVAFARGLLTVIGSTIANNTSPTGGGAIALYGAGSAARLRDSRFVGNSAAGQFFDELAGGGAVLAFGPGTSLDLADCTFDANAASSGGAGGSILISGAGAVATLTRVTMTNSRADAGGSGGGLAVGIAATGARVVLDDCTIRRCNASGAGGAIAVLGASGASVTLLGKTALTSCSATYGGAISAVSALAASPSALAPNLMALLPRGDGIVRGGSVLAHENASVVLEDCRASFGGSVFACGGFVNVSTAQLAGSSHASIGGGRAFVCTASDAALGSAGAGTRTGTVALSGYGPDVAGPPARLELSGFPAAQMSGVALGAGSAQALDAFGQVIRHRAMALRSELEPLASGGVASGGSLVDVLDDTTAMAATYSFGRAVLVQGDWPEALGAQIALRIGLESGGSLSTAPSSPIARVSVNVTGCVAGWGRLSPDGDALVCGPCNGETSTTAANAALGGLCEACPVNTLRAAAGCVCLAGFYSTSPQSDLPQCQACPAGGMCAGGSALPVPAAGFFPDSSGAFVACVNPSACLSGGLCARGYRGRLCGQCASGWYALNGACRACNRAIAVLAGLGLVLLAIAVAAALLWFNLATSSGYRFASASIGLMALQMLALFGRLQLDWGPLPESIFRLASTLSLNVQLTSPECSLSASIDAWQLRFWLTMALPVFSACAIALVAVLLLAIGRAWPRGRLAKLSLAVLVDGARRSWYQSLMLLYMPLIASALSIFGCRRDAAGVWILVDDPSHRCFDRRWRTQLLAPGLAFALLYGLAVPCAVVCILWRARRALGSVEFHLRYGFAVARFVPHFWYFEAVLMGQKLALVLALTALASENAKASGGVMVLMGSLVHLTTARPYARVTHQSVAAATQLAVSLTLLGGLLDDFLFRRLTAATGVVCTLGAIAVGLALDLVLYRREVVAAASDFKDSGLAVERDVDEGMEMVFRREVRGQVLPSASTESHPGSDGTANTIVMHASFDSDMIMTPPPL